MFVSLQVWQVLKCGAGVKVSYFCIWDVVWVVLYETEKMVCTKSMRLRFQMVTLLCDIRELTVVVYTLCCETFLSSIKKHIENIIAK